MPAEAPLKSKVKRPIYIRPSIHQRVRVLAGLEDKTLQECIEGVLPDIVERRIAALMLAGTTKSDFKRQAAGRGK